MTDYADAWFRTAFENAAIGMAVMTIDGEYLRVNRMLCSILGRDADALLGTSVLDVTHPDDRADTEAQLHRLATGEALAFEKRYLHADGHVVWAALHVSAVPDARDRPAYLVSQVQDISARRQMEETLRHAQKMDAVGRLAGGIAHDFNNLLTAARLNTDLLLQALPDVPTGPAGVVADESPRELVDEVRHALDRAAALTAQLLVVSRRSFARPASLDLNQVVQRLEPILQRLAGPRLMVRTRLDTAGVWTHADQGQIDEALLTLVGRARDAIGPDEPGTIELITGDVTLTAPRIDVFGELAPGRYATLAVRDDAPSLAPALLERVFEPFYFVRDGVDRGRIGLGLAAVYGIAQQAGGHVVAESLGPRGMLFTLFLPAL